VAAHYFTERRQIRGAAGAGGEDLGDLAEIGRPEHGVSSKPSRLWGAGIRE